MADIKLEEKQWLNSLSRQWGVLLSRGIAALLFAVALLVLPVEESIETLVFLFAIFVFIDGALQLITAVKERKHKQNWFILLLWGLVGIFAGIFTFYAPALTTIALVFYIAIWAIVKGVMEMFAAIRLRKEVAGEWLLILSGIISILFGALLLANPAAGAVAIVWIITFYAALFGLLFITFSLKLKKMKKVDDKVTT